MSESEPKTKISFNPSVVQFTFYTVGKLVAFVVGIFLFTTWVAGITFQTELKEFHREVVPEWEETMDDKIRLHELEAEQKYLKDMADIKESLIEIKSDIRHIKENGD